jgi:hypothetical protein
VSKYRYWFIGYGADCTETGLTTARAYVRTAWGGHPNHDSATLPMLRDFCRERFGKEAAFVQGVAPTPNWTVAESTEAAWLNAEPQRWGGAPTEVQRLTVTFERGGKFVLQLDEKNPKGPPKPTYEDLLEENQRLREVSKAAELAKDAP